MNQRILVTGGTGLLGAYLLRWLKQKGYSQITATYQNLNANIPEDLREGITWKRLALPDVIDAFEIVAGQDWVIHSAGYIAYDSKEKNKALEINREGTKQIVDACLDHQVKHLIYIGSIGALGKEKNFVTLNESTPWIQNEYTTNYGLSKYLAELEAWRGKSEGLNVSAVLPSVILGTGDWQRSSLQIFDRVVHKPGWYPTGQTGYVDVRDLAQFIVMLLEKNLHGERWLLSAENMPYGDLFRKIALELDLQKSFRPAPKWLAKILLHSANLFSKKQIGNEILNHTYGTFYYDSAKSLTVDGFSYRPISETLRDILEIYRTKTNKPIQF